MEITPEGNLINVDAVKKIEIVAGKVLIHYIDGTMEKHPLDGEWKKFLKRLADKE